MPGPGDDRPGEESVSTPEMPVTQRGRVHRRLHRTKRALVIGSVAGFGAVWGLVAQHVVGVTAGGTSTPVPQATVAPAAPQQPDSGGFFGDGGSNSVGPGGGSGSGPVAGSGAS